VTTAQHPYRPNRLRATFSGWKIGPQPIVGPFEVEIRLKSNSRYSFYQAYLMPTKSGSPKIFPQSKLDDCKRYIESQFVKKLSDWVEV
jgi:hypothetical protein